MPKKIESWSVDPKNDRIITAGYELSADEEKASISMSFSGLKTILTVVDKTTNTNKTYELNSKIPPGTGVKIMGHELMNYL